MKQNVFDFSGFCNKYFKFYSIQVSDYYKNIFIAKFIYKETGIKIINLTIKIYKLHDIKK